MRNRGLEKDLIIRCKKDEIILYIARVYNCCKYIYIDI